MVHVITQRCCNDAACVPVCPVDCIRPRPDDPDFTTAEMLYIDPKSCIDCGLCMEACPTSAIYNSSHMPDHLAEFEEINARYFAERPLEIALPELPPGRINEDLGPLRVAVIGAGAAASYAVGELVGRYPARVDVFEKLPTPWGLVRSGVAPDHTQTKLVTESFFAVNEHESVRLNLNVAIGDQLRLDELRQAYHAVIIGTGAAPDRRLGIEGESLPGSHAASDFVAWFNGHPDHAGDYFDLSGERAVIVGNGNVALDIARVLTADIENLAATDIADHALDALRHSNIREVIVLGRRGPAQAAYTIAEFVALKSMPGVAVVIDPEEAQLDPVSAELLDRAGTDPAVRLKVEAAARYAAARPTDARKRIVFRYLASPRRINGGDRATSLVIEHNELVEIEGRIVPRATDVLETIDTSLILRSVGYRGAPVDQAPFDERDGLIPNDSGRVVDATGESVAGLYVTGWIKRGPTGGIGANKHCARETVSQLIDDFRAGRLPQPTITAAAFDALIEQRCPDRVTRNGWAAIDSAEIARGVRAGRPRVKFVTIDDLMTASAQLRARA